MRLFSAIPFPEEGKQKIAELGRGRLPVPYLSTQNLHVTLLFFGDLDTDQTKMVTAMFEQSVYAPGPIKMEFAAIVKFHHQLHLTLKENLALRELQNGMEEYFTSRGFKFPNREYYPHAKLANLHMDNMLFRQRKVEDFPNQELSQLDFMADRVVLYESKLLMHHAHHYPLVEVPLK